MKPPVLHIEIPPETRAKMERLKTVLSEPAMLDVFRKGMDKGAAQAVSNIQQTRLTGEGPFPIEDHRLGVKTGRLRPSLRSVPAVVASNGAFGSVIGGIGTNVGYAAIHEFGGVIHRTVKAGKVRLRTDKGGNLMRQGDNLAIFAKRKGKGVHKRFREVEFAGGKTYDIRIPARASLGHGLADNETTLTRAIARAISTSLRGGTSE
ncbi:MAG: hypothetical protein PHQ12_04760 [Chthoniobacteraceae bacterium]|nr:hypothetical protein [Chthoniobacteraceae bacterium]